MFEPDPDEDYGVPNSSGESPELTLQRRALETTGRHELGKQASAEVYCRPIVMLKPVSFIENSNIPAGTKDFVRSEIELHFLKKSYSGLVLEEIAVE